MGLDEQLDGLDAIRGGDAGAHAVAGMTVHADRERGAEHTRVRGGLRRELETLAIGRGERNAEVSRTDAGHEVDDLRRDLLGRAHEIPLVFAALVVDEDDDAARSQLIQDLGNGGEGHG